MTLNAWEAQERLGSPEGELAIAHAVVYLACAPKSNAVYTASKAAREDARSKGSLEVPLHLRNAPTRLMKDLGYGEDYRYAHDEEDGHAAGEQYFPDDMSPVKYYHPVPRGLEIRIRDVAANLARRRGFHFDADAYLLLEERRKVLQVETQDLQRERNANAKCIGKAKAAGEDIAPLVAAVKDLGDRLDISESKLQEVQSGY